MSEETSLQSILPFNHLDENSFNIALYEMSHGTLNYNSSSIGNGGSSAEIFCARFCARFFQPDFALDFQPEFCPNF